MDKSVVFKNIVSLGLMQVANALIPLMLVPFVVRALGVEVFGKVSYAQTVVAYFTLLVNYGFEYSATQEVALCRGDNSRMRLVFWSVMKSKAVLFSGAFLVFSLMLAFVPKMRGEVELYLLAFLVNLGMLLSPTWFFQGMETMGKVAVVNVAMKFAGAVLTVFFVLSPSDYCLYVLFMSLSYCLAGGVLFFRATSGHGLSYVPEYDFGVVRRGFPIFLNNIFSNVYALGGMTVVGVLLADLEVGLYAGAHKIVSAVSMLLSMPLSMALFPSLSREFEHSPLEGWRKLRSCLRWVVLMGGVFTVFFYFSSPLVVRLFLGEEFLQVVPLLQALSLIPVLVVLATMMTVQGMYGMRMQRYAPYVGFSILCVSLFLYFSLIPMYGLYGAAAGYLLSEAMEILIVYSLLRHRIRKLSVCG